MEPEPIHKPIHKEVLNGHPGRCHDYKLASGIGKTRQPFTWLSSTDVASDNARLASELLEFKSTRETVAFEAWEFIDDRWQLVLSSPVRVIYTEVDSKRSKVRALLQWGHAE